MGRTNYAILAMGIASMLMLSMLMKQFLHSAEDRKRSPVIEELGAMFGGRLDRRCELAFEHTSRGPRAVVTVYPLPSTAVQKLATDVGEYVWRRLGDEQGLASVDVVCRPWSSEVPMRFAVEKPYTGTPRPPAAGKKSPPAAAPPSAPAPERR